jgi:hypothetical protein
MRHPFCVGSSGRSGGSTIRRTMNLTCSQSISLIVPAATSRSSSSVFIREMASSSSIATHRDRRSAFGISGVDQADRRHRGLALQPRAYPTYPAMGVGLWSLITGIPRHPNPPFKLTRCRLSVVASAWTFHANALDMSRQEVRMVLSRRETRVRLNFVSAECPGLENRSESSKRRLRHSGFSGAVETALHSVQSQGPFRRAQRCRLNVRFARTEACRLH